ncbi:MAG: ribosome maturation factor RimM [Ahrensia sp.]
MSENKLQSPVLMGVIGAPHGVKGQVRVKSYTGDPLALGDYGPLFDAAGKAYQVADIRSAKNVVVVTFEGVSGRSAAEALNGVELFIERDQLPDDTLDEDEFYIEDLVGMDVLDGSGKQIGTVMTVQNFGAGDMIEVSPMMANGSFSAKTVFYPFTKLVVPKIDFDAYALTLIAPTEVTVAPEGSKEREADPDFKPDAGT